MKFSCEKALLTGAVAVASRAVAAKSSIPAMEGILIEAGDQLRLTGYNLETGIRATVPAEIRETGSLVLSARLFGEIVRKMPDDVVVFSTQGYTVNIKCGLSEFNILGTDPEEFPELPAVEQQNALTIGQPTLRAMISQTLFAVSDNESRPVHTGSLFEVEGGSLTVVSVDGYRLALRREKVAEKKGEENFSFVVPGSALGEVEKICSGEEDVEIVQGARHVQFQTGDTVLVCRRLEGEFLAYRNAIPRNNTIHIQVDSRTLLSSIERVSLIISEKLKSPCGASLGTGWCPSPPGPLSATPPTSAPSPGTARGWRSDSTTSTSWTPCGPLRRTSCAWSSPPGWPPASSCPPRGRRISSTWSCPCG